MNTNTVFVLAAWLVISAPARAESLDSLYQRHAASHGLDWRLLKALAQVESAENPRAENPDGLSSGLLQILCAPAHARHCRNRFDIAGWPPPSRAALHDPDYNAHLAAQILAWNRRHYGLPKAIAVYNRWGARHTPAGRPFPNQRYVEAVLARYRALGGQP